MIDLCKHPKRDGSYGTESERQCESGQRETKNDDRNAQSHQRKEQILEQATKIGS
jgi:hypothetical protein